MARLLTRAVALCALLTLGGVLSPSALAHHYLPGEFESGQFGSTVQPTGPLETVFDWSKEPNSPPATNAPTKCDQDHLPDAPARAFKDANNQIQLLATHYTNRRLIGPNFNSLNRDCSVVMYSSDPADGNPEDPANFNHQEWIGSTYVEGHTVHALIHAEYHGDQFRNADGTSKTCRDDYASPIYPDTSSPYINCWWNTITAARSLNDGNTYQQLGVGGNHLVASMPYQYPQRKPPITPPPPRGLGMVQPSNIFKKHPYDGYHYAFFKASAIGSPLGYRDQPNGMCLMRTDNISNPASWKAWDGDSNDPSQGFTRSFVSPYPNEPSNPQNHVCAPVTNTMNIAESVTWNTYLKKYVLVGREQAACYGGCPPQDGIYYSLSDDLIKWSPRRLLMKGVAYYAPPAYWGGSTSGSECATKGANAPHRIGHPSLIDHDSTSPNFETADDTAYLYFVVHHCDLSDLGNIKDRDLVRIPIRFSRGRMVDFGREYFVSPTPPYGFDEIEQVGGSFTHERAAAAEVGDGGSWWHGRAECSPWNTPCSTSAAFDVLWPDGDDAQYSGWFWIGADFFKNGASPSFFLTRWDNFRLASLDTGNPTTSAYKDYGGILVTKTDNQNPDQPQLEYKAQLARGQLGSPPQRLGDKWGVKDSFTIPANRWFWVWVWQFSDGTYSPPTDRPATYVYLNDGVTGQWAIYGLQSENTYGRLIDRIRYGLIGAQGNPMRFVAGPAQQRRVALDVLSSWAP